MRNRILQYLQQQPFQPFRLHLTNGAVYVVRHPDQVMVTPTYLVVGLPAAEGSTHEVSDVVNVSLLHVVSVEPFTPTTPSNAN